MNASWTATHKITRPSGTELVMLVDDGAAYTQGEWDASDTADYERTETGEWTFQGHPFAGTVERIATPAFFVVPAPGHYGDRARVTSSHRSLAAARKAAGVGYVVRVGAMRKGDQWLRSDERVYPVASDR